MQMKFLVTLSVGWFLIIVSVSCFNQKFKLNLKINHKIVIINR